MTETVYSNVLPFDGRRHSGDSGPSGNRLAVLNSCRDQLASRVASAFLEGLSDSQDHLFEMADRASSLDMQNLYFAAHGTLRKRGQELLKAFQSQFTRIFDRAVASQDKSAQPPLEDLGELRLVDDLDFERDLAVGKLAARVSYNCAHQLTTLARRVAELLEIRSLEPEDNPLGPKAMFNAFLETALDLEVGDQIALALLQEFDRQIGDQLPGLYQSLNRLLIDHDILPDLPQGPGERVHRGEPSAGGMSSIPVPEQTAAGREPLPAPESPASPPGPLSRRAGDADYSTREQAGNPNDFFLQLVSGLRAFQSPATSAGIPTQGNAQPASPMAAQLLQGLTSLQRAEPGVRTGSGPGWPQLASGAKGILREIRGMPIASLASPLDGVTIDVVATLFDLIFSDHELPDALRAQIARLQIPALKVALIDKRFFSDKQHPARRFLDAIAGSTIGRSPDQMPALLAEIEALIDAVIEGFDNDTAIFSAQLERLEAFLAQEDEQAQTQAIQLVEGLERRDRIERARSIVSDQIDRRIKNRDVPPLVSDFLSKLWRLYLLRVFVDKGKESASWRGALQTMDDLVWSVLPKHDREERRRLLNTLPDLLHRLRSGLDGLVISKADRDEFFRALVRLHMAAMRADLPEDDADPQADNSAGLVLSAPPQDSPVSQAQEAAESTVIPDDPKPAPAPSSPPDPGDKYVQAARELSLGAWVEFTSERGTRRTLRLTWVSGLKTIYLFAGRQGDDPLSLPAARLAQRLREGSARILSGDRLTERAVNQLLEATKKEASQPAAD